jgi:DMSO/TMAO reductase YedYZ molybdopterin-dependent catalytic subunit
LKKSSAEDLEIQRKLKVMTRRGLVFGGTAILVGGTAWKWIASRSKADGIAWPLRKVLELDEKVGRATFDPKRLSPTFPVSLVRMPRLNGRIGVDLNLDLDAWRLEVEGPTGKRSLTMEEVKALPRFEVTTELRCVEGWSEIVTWAGARLVDLAAFTGLASTTGKPGDPLAIPAQLLPYVSLQTPNQKYFVGLDIASALHPQTLLCYEMNGQPLTREHGAPLRLSIPIKYGIKSLKQIGKIQFTSQRPSDYWELKGYDWYAGH